MMIYVRCNISLIMSPAKFSSAYMKVFQRIFKKMFKNQENNKEMIQSEIDDLIMEIEGIIDRLDSECEHRPLQLMGIKATFALMNRVYATLFTIAASVMQKVYATRYQ